MKLTDLLALCHVPRWLIVSILRPQSVAEHSFRVWVIYHELCRRLEIFTNPGEERLALIHDAAECRTGDIPGDFKHRATKADWEALELTECPWLEFEPSLHPLSSLVKIADLIETYTYIRMWGHGEHALNVADRVFGDLHKFVLITPFADHFDKVDSICDDIIHDVGRSR